MATNIIRRQKIAVVKPVISTTIYPFILDRAIKKTSSVFSGRIIRPIKNNNLPLEFWINLQCDVPLKIGGDSPLILECTSRLLGGVEERIDIRTIEIQPGDSELKRYSVIFIPSDNTNLSITISSKNAVSRTTYMNKITLAYLEMKEE